MWHVVHRELAAALAFGDALRKNSGADAVRQRHTVADKQDHVLRLARAGIVDVPRHRAAAHAVADFDLVSPGFVERHVAQQQAD
jgi:hypothetical protein